eukprot:13161644-Alexandrium_andersonii.AAC.1
MRPCRCVLLHRDRASNHHSLPSVCAVPEPLDRNLLAGVVASGLPVASHSHHYQHRRVLWGGHSALHPVNL